ncbi:helix-turn-helix transcriptional regulator [Rosenbergiella australiborealis]|uniref:helix-turn-helix transcriptional regulator n=1 Tax=Rosenbergiella australiborealis TaxID=1544696 RepID=UPI001F4DD84E|nr:AlpA family phage regulatory protein [Rosenbergiella australiborealis]
MSAWLNKDELVRKTSMSMSTIDRLEKRGEFPSRFVDVTNRVKWDEDEVSQWMDEVKEKSRKLQLKPSTKPDFKLTKKWQESNNSPSTHQ